MQDKRVLRAGAASALGLTLCFCAGAQASAANNKDSVLRVSNKPPTNMQIQPLGADQMQASSALGLSSSPQQITPWQELGVRTGDSLSRVFSRAGLPSSQWRKLLALGHSVSALGHIHPGDTLDIRKTPAGKLAELRYRLDSIKTLHISRHGTSFQARVEKRATQSREITATGQVGHASLSHAMRASGLPANVIAQIIHVYKQRRDLRHLRQGDQFAVVYRAAYSHGQQIAAGPVLASSITVDHHTYKAFRAKGENGQFGYFDTTGKPYKPAFTRKPVAYTRISSPFNLHRMNPVTHHIQPHKGVDMAAPTGTPIHAAAKGTVKYAGRMSGYGRIVELTNFDGYSTRYAHMHKIRSGLRKGEHVSKGEVIGYVGQSGEATGPHLHFEIRRHGVAYNPLTVDLPSGHVLSKSRMVAYTHKIQPLIAKLSPAPTSLLARTSSAPANSNHCTHATAANSTLVIDPVGAARHHSRGSIFCVVARPPNRA